MGWGGGERGSFQIQAMCEIASLSPILDRYFPLISRFETLIVQRQGCPQRMRHVGVAGGGGGFCISVAGVPVTGQTTGDVLQTYCVVFFCSCASALSSLLLLRWQRRDARVSWSRSYRTLMLSFLFWWKLRLPQKAGLQQVWVLTPRPGGLGLIRSSP